MNFAQDLFYAFRTLRKSPSFIVLAVATAGLGISANAAIFSLFYQVLLRSLPVPQPERLVVFHAGNLSLPGRNSNDTYESVFSYPMYRALLDSTRSFQGLAARSGRSVQIEVNGAADRVQGELVSGNFFEVLGVRPWKGRTLLPSDDRTGAGNAVAVLSFDYWMKRFHGDAAAIHRTVRVNGDVFTIIGVAPEGFRGVLSGSSPDLYFPLSMVGRLDPGWEAYDNPSMARFTILGRLAPGVSREKAAAELAPKFAAGIQTALKASKVTSQRIRKDFESKKLQLLPATRGLNQLERQWRKPLLVLASMAALLLLIGCANLASLLLARGVNRSRDTAIRLALGAGRGRIFSMLLAESLLIAACGALVGILLTPLLTSGVLKLLPADETGGWLAGGISLPVLGFCALLMAISGVVSGVVPAWQSARTSAISALGDRTAAISGRHFSPRFRQSLLVGQMALALVLLSTAGLFGKSLINLMRYTPGFRAGRVLTFSLDAGAGGYTATAGVALYGRIVKELKALPGVDAVSIADSVPFSNSESSSNVTVEGDASSEGEDLNSDKNSVGPDFFRTLGGQLLTGREFDERDLPGAPKVAIVNAAFVKRFCGTRNPIGLHMESGAGGPLDLEIVGVVGDLKNMTLREPVKPTYYLPYEQSKVKAKSFSATFLVRGNGNSLTAEARRVVTQLARTLPLFNVATMQTRIDNSIYTDRLLAALTTVFGLLALMLTAVGLYGVIAYSVGRRTAEIGIRMALGATGGSVIAMVLREVAFLTSAGAIGGIALAAAATRSVRSQLFGLDGLDPAVLAAVVLSLALVSLLAGAIPALRAAKIDPLRALQHD